MRAISKFRCPECNHKFLKNGHQVLSDLYYCICEHCGSGVWIDIETGKDYFGRIYSIDKYTYCKCKEFVIIPLSNPVRCEKCKKMIHKRRIQK